MFVVHQLQQNKPDMEFKMHKSGGLHCFVPPKKAFVFVGPSGNPQGGCKFLSLNSMKNIVRRSWDSIPMPVTVIDRVNKPGKDKPRRFAFTDSSIHRFIGAVELPGVDGDKNEIPPQQIEELAHADPSTICEPQSQKHTES
jgi:hypothetical protein